LVGEFFGDVGFVVIVVGDERAVEADAGEHRAGGAGVLARDKIDGAEEGAGAVGEVGEVADGRGDDVEVAGLGRERSVGSGVGHEVMEK